ncbi:MAG: GNAT family N-acetyltransferase [Acidimicrobiia bacterium]
MPFRTARSQDIDAIAAFTTGTFDWGDYVPESISGWIADASGRVLVAVDDDDRPVAIGRGLLLTPQEAWFHAARVHPAWRGRGIASDMAVALADWARTQGALVARLLIEQDNAASVRHIAKTGFRQTAVVHRGCRDLQAPSPQQKGNGGQRRRSLMSAQRGTRFDAEMIAASWPTSDAGRAMRGLIGRSWAFHRLRSRDVETAAGEGRLWAVGSAWAIVDERDGIFEIGLLDAAESDAGVVVRALVDLAADRDAHTVWIWHADLRWLTDAVAAAGCESEASGIYALGL